MTIPRSRREVSLRFSAIELAVEKRDRATRDDDRMVDVAENHRHVAEQRIDDEARDEQQQRIDARSAPSRGQSPLWIAEGQRLTETAVLLCGHGSRDCEAIAEFELVAAALRPRLPAVRCWHRVPRIRPADDP